MDGRADAPSGAVAAAPALLDAYLAERPRLLGLAYRITGSRAEAEDVVQEAWLRLAGRQGGPDRIERPAAWLTTVVSRLALDRLDRASRRRETYVGPWLPEPVVAAATTMDAATVRGDPERVVELGESLTLGFLVLLDTLTPVERVVFLLADVFAVPFAEIASTVDRTPEACRQIASRARRRVQDGRRRVERPADARATVDALLAALVTGDVDAAVRLLADDAVLVSDGGPDRHAARRPVVGAPKVARFLVNIARRFPTDAQVELPLVNGEPGLVLRLGGRVELVASFSVAGDRVVAVRTMLNPDKLTGVDRHDPVI